MLKLFTVSSYLVLILLTIFIVTLCYDNVTAGYSGYFIGVSVVITLACMGVAVWIYAVYKQIQNIQLVAGKGSVSRLASLLMLANLVITFIVLVLVISSIGRLISGTSLLG